MIPDLSRRVEESPTVLAMSDPAFLFHPFRSVRTVSDSDFVVKTT